MATKKATKRKSSSKSTRSTAAKKSSSKKSTGRKYSPSAGKDVEREMHAMKQGKLKSGRSGKKVTSRKQAIAIGLSEARKEGKKVSAKKCLGAKPPAKVTAVGRMLSKAPDSESSAQLAVFYFRLNGHCLHFRVLLVRAGAGIECVGMPGANNLSTLDRSFAKRTAFMGTGSIENTDLSLHVGYAQRSAANRKLLQRARRWKLAFRTNPYKVQHGHLSPVCCWRLAATATAQLA